MTDQVFAIHLAELHDKKAKDIIKRDKYLFDYFVDAGIFGPRVISHTFGVHSFIVNSTAAKEILLSNCNDRKPRIEVLYHPVFELEPGVSPSSKNSKSDEEFVIGSYGNPSLTKLTNVVIDACQMLVEEGRKVRLILSGYGTKIYLERHFGDRPPAWIDARHHSNEAGFQRDMTECDVAIQLRKYNLGESSGVIPTLLKMTKTVITSPIGAFTAYGDAVVYFEGNAAALADLLRQNVCVSSERIHDYVSMHGVQQFNEAFRALLNDGHGSTGLPALRIGAETSVTPSQVAS